MIIGIDFDGTCVTHKFPELGEEIGAAPVLKKLVAAGHELILFTSKKGLPVSEETKNKISLSLLGKESKKKRKVKQLDMNNNLIQEFSSITEAKLLTGIKGINNALTGRAKTAGGYLWE